MFIKTKISKNDLSAKIKKMINDKKFIDILINMVIFSKYINNWNEFNNSMQNEIIKKEKRYLIKLIENI